jgi:hypothetical protein
MLPISILIFICHQTLLAFGPAHDFLETQNFDFYKLTQYSLSVLRVMLLALLQVEK